MTVLLLYLIKSSKFNLQDSKITYYFLILLAMLMTTSASSQVTADFTTMGSTTACGSLIVEFQDLSTGNPNSWLWDLGNGNTSTLKNPVAVYSSPGSYDVKLTVSDDIFSDTKIEMVYIKVYDNPITNIDIALSNIGCVTHSVDFLDLTTSSSPIVSHFWDFGDGGNSSLQNPTYNYSSVGLYTVSLFVIDANNCQDLLIIPDYIKTFNPPQANFIADKLFSCNMDEVVSFDDLSIGNNLTYFWDFGDGTTSTFQNPIHNFNAGVFTVRLVVNNGVCTDTLTMVDYIEVGAVAITDFTTNITSGCNDLNVQFTDLSTIGVDSWLWNFGDGNTSVQQNPTHVYTNAGIYDVILKTSVGSICISDKTIFAAIEVFDKPTIVFSSNATFSCDTPFVVDFMDQTIDAISWNWDFGNSNTSTLETPTEVYNLEGTYTVTITVTNINLCANTLVITNYISIKKPVIQFSANTLSGCNPLNTTFTDSSVTSQSITTWNWNFGDGNTSTLQNPIHLYTASGFYDVSLQIIDNLGCSATQTINSYIQVADPPQANFVAAPIITCAGNTVNFSDLSTSSLQIDGWLWDFGDGISASTQNPTHTYNIVGNYNVSLIASALGCADSFEINNYIQIIEPTAFFIEAYNCPNPLEVDFTNLSIGADFVSWDFGDGTNSIQINPSHTFPSRGTYNVMLSATNSTTACTHDYILPIRITEPIANFTYFVNANCGLEDSVGCKPHQVFLDNLSQDMSYYKVLWEDGYVGYGRSDHIFDTIGTFDVIMIITDIHLCKDTFMYNNMYSIKGVDADFEKTNMMGCDSMFVTFNDLSVPNSSVQWQFGDGGTSTLNQPQYIYYNEGLYDVTIYAESSFGCRDTMKKIEYIQFVYPAADFSVSQTTACYDIPINFTNISVGIGLTYMWDFGDGTTSNNFNTIHSYNQDGVFDISLSVVDSFGCTNIFLQSNHISVREPIADFNTNTVSSNCPPLISSFNNLSTTDAILWTWDFGDGTSSTINSPSHLYANSGVFDVKLMVENSFGCRDTFVQIGLINISGPMGTYTISPSDICLDDTAFFIPTSVNTSNYFWDFGDGNFSVDSFPTHVYLSAGVYYPSLILENSFACQFTVQSQDSIVVNMLNIDAGNTITICKNDSISLLAISDPGNIVWSPANLLSDPTIVNPVATPITTTTFTVAISDGQCDNTDTVRVVVNQDIPIPSMSFTNQCEDDTLMITANSGLSTNNISWLWDLENGSNSILQNPTHHFSTSGSYLLSLLVVNLDNSCETKIYQTVDIYDNPIVDFMADEVCFGELSSFNDVSISNSGNLAQWTWDFGDGVGISIQKNPKYLYATDGLFSVYLSVLSDYGCENQITKNIMVNPLPFTDFITTEACMDDFNYFQSVSTIALGNITNWIWNFGDGTNFVGDRETVHQYATEGTFDVNLVVITDKGCEGEITHQAIVYPLPNPVFTSDNFCEGDITLFFENSNITSGNIISWNWNFGDGIGTANYNNPTYQFAYVGTYPISLTIMSDKLCENSITNNITISPLPNVDIYAMEKACIGEEIKFIDLSLVENGYITDWNWNFGDGVSASKQEVIHIYQQTGTFSVSLEVISNVGCIQNKIYLQKVFNNPIANFSADTDFPSIFNPEVSFSDKSVDASTWLWDFGTGEMSAEQNPSITFSDTGVYMVSLMVTNTYGCSDKFSKEISVRPEFTIFIPNAFTPNDDGLDDIFMVYGMGMINCRMIIYNRWGEQIFQSNNKALGWNGKDRFDNYLPNGTYLYHFAITDFNSKPWVYNGEIILMR